MLSFLSDRFNRFLNVTFDSASGTLLCTSQRKCNCTCHIEYGICKNQSMIWLTMRNLSGDPSRIKLENLKAPHYCYSVSTTNMRLTVVVHGMFLDYSGNVQPQKHCEQMNCNTHLTVIYAMASSFVIILIAILLVVFVLCIYVRSKPRNANLEFSSPIYDDLADVKETSIYADRNVAYSSR